VLTGGNQIFILKMEVVGSSETSARLHIKHTNKTGKMPSVFFSGRSKEMRFGSGEGQ
jgi:hypothetical protein